MNTIFAEIDTIIMDEVGGGVVIMIQCSQSKMGLHFVIIWLS